MGKDSLPTLRLSLIHISLGLNAQNYSEASEDSSLQLFDNCRFLNDMPLAFCIIELVFDAEGHGVDLSLIHI